MSGSTVNKRSGSKCPGNLLYFPSNVCHVSRRQLLSNLSQIIQQYDAYGPLLTI